MKKSIAWLLLLCMILCLGACGNAVTETEAPERGETASSAEEILETTAEETASTEPSEETDAETKASAETLSSTVLTEKTETPTETAATASATETKKIETTAPSGEETPIVAATNGTDAIFCRVENHSVNLSLTDIADVLPSLSGETFSFSASDGANIRSCNIYRADYSSIGSVMNKDGGETFAFNYDLEAGTYYVMLRLQIGEFSVTNSRQFSAYAKLIVEAPADN